MLELDVGESFWRWIYPRFQWLLGLDCSRNCIKLLFFHINSAQFSSSCKKKEMRPMVVAALSFVAPTLWNQFSAVSRCWTSALVSSKKSIPAGQGWVEMAWQPRCLQIEITFFITALLKWFLSLCDNFLKYFYSSALERCRSADLCVCSQWPLHCIHTRSSTISISSAADLSADPLLVAWAQCCAYSFSDKEELLCAIRAMLIQEVSQCCPGLPLCPWGECSEKQHAGVVAPGCSSGELC